MRFRNPVANSARFVSHEKVQVDWLHSLAVGTIGAAANAVIGGVAISAIDPIRFNAQNPDFYKLVLALFLTSAVINIFMYLKEKPSPFTTRLPTQAQFGPWPPADRRGRHLRLVSGSKRT